MVIGGGASGVSAGIQAARMGVNVLIVEKTDWLGGMLTAAGVSAVDGNYKLPAGVWGEFMNRLAIHYGGLDSLKTGWVSNVLFEPSVGNAIFNQMVDEESNLTVWKKSLLKKLWKDKDVWRAIIFDEAQHKQVVEAKVVIDATELGDVAKLCGVSYDIGMESKQDTGEDIAPEKANNIVQDMTYVAILKDYGKD
ncbi:Glucose-inhibited division protein A-related protein, partial [gut metagenome]